MAGRIRGEKQTVMMSSNAVDTVDMKSQLDNLNTKLNMVIENYDKLSKDTLGMWEDIGIIYKETIKLKKQ